MGTIEINEMLQAFRIYLKKGLKEAVRLFPEYENFIYANKEKTFRDVEADLLGQSNIKVDQAQKIAASAAGKIG